MYEGRASRWNVKATTTELYEVVRLSFTGEVVRADQIAPFLLDKGYLRELWQSDAEPGTLL